MDLLAALRRHSVRGFKPDPVPRETLDRIFAAAQLAPSWCNVQPWRAWVASGQTRARLVEAMTAAAKAGGMSPDWPWPMAYPPPYDEHRKVCGKALYGAMSISRHDMEGRYAAWMRNYLAFDAPHVAIVGVDKRLGFYAALDTGCWLEALLLAAEAEGVSTCPQASLAAFPAPIRATLPIPDEVGILFGIAIGYEDPSVAANACRTTRAPVEQNIRFLE